MLHSYITASRTISNIVLSYVELGHWTLRGHVQTIFEKIKVIMMLRGGGSIGKNDSNREMNLRAKPNVMNQAINRRACDKMKGQITSQRMVITKARAMTFGLGGKLKHLFIFYALFFSYYLCTFVQSYKI